MSADPIQAAIDDTMIELRALLDERGRKVAKKAADAIAAEHRQRGLSEATAQRLLDALRECCEYQRDAERLVDKMLLLRGENTPERLTVKSIARTLRPALLILAEPHRYGAAEYVHALRVVDEVVSVAAPELLGSKSLRHELRGKAHRALLVRLSGSGVVGGGGATIVAAPHLEAVS